MLGPLKTPYPVTKQTPFHLANAQSNNVIQVFQPKIAVQMPNWLKESPQNYNKGQQFQLSKLK